MDACIYATWLGRRPFRKIIIIACSILYHIIQKIAQVDVVHTNGVVSVLLIGFGMVQPIGHVDFYPNGGTNQPGCMNGTSFSNITFNPIKTFTKWATCSHDRVVDLFRYTMGSCSSLAYSCSDYFTYSLGLCHSCGSTNTSCATFGITADTYPTRSQSHVKMYFTTSSPPPYCSIS